MRFRKVISFLIVSIICISTVAYARPMKLEEPIFLGTVKDVNKESDGRYRVLVQGYIKGCEIYPEELITFITNDTKILSNLCGVNNTINSLQELNIEVGDNVYLVLSNAMTKSIPPQVSAKKIQLTKGVKE